MIHISFLPEDKIDAIIHKRIFGESGEPPPYSSHDGTAMKIVAKMREQDWCWEILVMPGSVDVKLFLAAVGLESAIETSAPTLAEAVCIAAKKSTEAARPGEWKIERALAAIAHGRE